MKDDYAQPLLGEIDAQTAACAQCHNATCDNVRYIIGKDGKTVEDVGPYRYGFDTDSLKKASLEDGVLTGYDEKVGVEIFYLGHPDGELFHGSTHEKQGLTCVSCHMPEPTAVSPLASSAEELSASDIPAEASDDSSKVIEPRVASEPEIKQEASQQLTLTMA